MKVNRQLQANAAGWPFRPRPPPCALPPVANRLMRGWAPRPDLLLLDATGQVRRLRAVSTICPWVSDLSDEALGQDRKHRPAARRSVVLFSDGLLEAENEDGQAFGYERLGAALASAEADHRLESVKKALGEHRAATAARPMSP